MITYIKMGKWVIFNAHKKLPDVCHPPHAGCVTLSAEIAGIFGMGKALRPYACSASIGVKHG